MKSYVLRQILAIVEAIKLELKKLEKADFIEPSTSLDSAPTIFVKKPNGTLIPIICFRLVNNTVIDDAYIMHKVKDQIEAMSGFSLL